ncbi:hypothetical protein Dimus_008991 [Dionaea muscipula]
MTPWSKELVIRPGREVWIRCFGVPIHARCPGTFTSIGQQWNVVLLVEFSSRESGLLEEGRVLFSTEVIDRPLNCVFTLRVNGKDFACRVVEGYPLNTQRL